MPGLGTKETELIANLSDERMRVFSVADASKLMNISRKAASDLVLRLFGKKKLIRIEKGKYLLVPPEAWKTGEYTEEGILIASRLVEPYYLSYWTALSFYGWTEQPSKTLFVATTKTKRPVKIQGMQIKFIRLRKERFFGYEDHWLGNQKIKVADQEKTIVDCLDQPRYCGEIVEVAKGLWNGKNDLDFDNILEYSLKMKNGTIFKRLGFLLDVLEINRSSLRKKLKEHKFSGYSLLDPGKKGKGFHNSEWNLYVNIDPNNLIEWRRH